MIATVWRSACGVFAVQRRILGRYPTLLTSAITAALPTARGPLSLAVLEALTTDPSQSTPFSVAVDDAHPYGADLHLALYVCYELHYRGFAGVAGDWEWNVDLLRLRAAMERVFLGYVRDNVEPGEDAVAEMDALSREPVDGSGASYYLRDHGSWEQMREYFALRSLYHLKEADPHAWAIPRLTGQAKASFVAVEFDEYGGGRGDRVHQALFADLLAAADLDSAYLGYIDHVPAEALATVNLMSLFGLRRSLRGAVVGHFAATEITSSPGSKRLVGALERMAAPEPCIAFYAEHVEADAVHEQVLRHDVVGDLIAREPELAADVVFGIRAGGFVEDKLSDYLLSAWEHGRTALVTS
ncbi:iron-containing redox enzyme family protein [Antrihabitans sp. YC3-6]|uniref:Iron-containing redox enzyme family protein n=1 Tax=Antrihabitans stalagmiti TaxID=2799499 RepID=A0A934NMR4_9NOCA|nr:iron-containing redox enzyme family protein [Antrihabitans stalagmiti]